MDWAYLFEICLTGIASGGLYALAALAFVMVYKATRVVNIAIGEMLMVGAYLFFTAPSSSESNKAEAPKPKTRIVPQVGGNSGGLMVLGSF